MIGCFTKRSYRPRRKVLSLSDGSAAYIKKGSRNLIGYKPQLVRSENGFVTSLIATLEAGAGQSADQVSLLN